MSAGSTRRVKALQVTRKGHSSPWRGASWTPNGRSLGQHGVDLFGANFHGADLRGVSFEGANLKNAILTDAQTEGANFDAAIMPDGRRNE